MGRRRTPNYWWDFHWVGDNIVSIHVKADVDYVPSPVKVFAIPPTGPCDRLIEDVVQPFLEGLREGRIDPRRAA